MANKKTGLIIAGHGAVEAARQLGMRQVPVIWTNIDPGKALILLLADNRLAALADDDPAKLAQVFELLKVDYSGLNIEATGYTLEEITKFIPDGGEPYQDNFNSDAALEQIEEPETQPGDLWLLGGHRVLCGDATDPEAVKTLMNGRKARLVVTDPPYNVSYDQGNNINPPKIHKVCDVIKNDSMTRPQFEAFLKKVMRSLFSVSDGPFYIFMSCQEWPQVMRAFEEAGGHWSSTIIWNKSNHVISRKDYHPKFEPILYGWKRPEDLLPDYQPILYGWQGGAHVQHLTVRNKSDVWEFSKQAKNPDHPTEKPIELMAEPILNSSGLGDLIVDLFLGSGSCLIAAEQTGRICYGMELEPRYVDLIKKRWEELTGKQAARIPAVTL